MSMPSFPKMGKDTARRFLNGTPAIPTSPDASKMSCFCSEESQGHAYRGLEVKARRLQLADRHVVHTRARAAHHAEPRQAQASDERVRAVDRNREGGLVGSVFEVALLRGRDADAEPKPELVVHGEEVPKAKHF